MILSLFILFLPSVLPQSLCPHTSFGLSECSQDQVRTAVEFPLFDPCPDLHPVLFQNLTCQIPCVPGTFLGFNETSKENTCVPCPANQYSLGGGMVFRTPFLNDVFDYFSPRCGRRKDAEIGVCAGWGLSMTEDVLETNAAFKDGWQEADLIGTFHLLRPGHISLLYRKQTRIINSNPIGEFSIRINKALNLEDSTLDQHWKNVSFSLPLGQVEIELRYRFYHIEGVEMEAEIREMEIEGVKLADFECWKCRDGLWSRPGSSVCSSCPLHHLFDQSLSQCVPCPAVPSSEEIQTCRPLPMCREEDFTLFIGPCIDGQQWKEYKLQDPTICNVTGVSPPSSKLYSECQDCMPGYYYESISNETQETVCTPCPLGFRSDFAYRDRCISCLSGEFAPRVLNYTVWRPFPTEFRNECLSKKGRECKLSKGWGTSNKVLYSGSSLLTDEELILSRYIDIVQDSAFVSFSYTLQGRADSRVFSLEIDSIEVVKTSQIAVLNVSPRIPLKKGIRKLAFVLKNAIENDAETSLAEVFIHYIEILGSNEGGAAECRRCPAGSISQINDRSECQNCPAGTTSNEDRRECVQCGPDEYALKPGSQCLKCPEYTISTEDRTACISPKSFPVGTRRIEIQELSRTHGYPGICKKTSIRVYCKDSFYGPIRNDAGSYFLSVLNPAKMTEINGNAEDLPYGYVYAWRRAKDLNQTVWTPSCENGNQEVLLNMGSRVRKVVVNSSKIDIEYDSGSPCLGDGSLFSSLITLECDKTAGEGWPMILPSENMCQVRFLWKTAFACRVCEERDLLRMTSLCSSGVRYETIREPQNCITLEVQNYEKQEVSCSESQEALSTWPVLAGMGIFVFLLLLSCVLLVSYVKTRRSYIQLIEMSAVHGLET